VEYCYVGGGKTTEESIEIIDLLRRNVPHIHWEMLWGDHDVGVDGVRSYSYIAVPDYQLNEAEYVIGLMEDGDDLSEYRSEDRFPELFDEYHVLPSITSFAENVQELISLLTCIPCYDIKDYLRELSLLLSTIYTLQFDLPNSKRSSYYQSNSDICLHPGLKPFLTYYDNHDPFERKQEDQNLKEIFEDLVESLETGLLHYDRYLETRDYKQLAIAVSEWKYQFTSKYGWGTSVVNAQKVIHHIRVYLQKGKLPVDGAQIRPKSYLFAHCISDIDTVDCYETVLADYDMLRFHQDLSSFARGFGETMISHYQEWFDTIDLDILIRAIDSHDISPNEISEVTQLLSPSDRDLIGNMPVEDWPFEDISNGVIWNCIWNVVNNRIKNAETKIRNREEGLGIIVYWVNLYNEIMEDVISSVHGEGSSISIRLGDAVDFPPYFIENLLERIDYHTTKGHKYILNQFSDVILDLSRLVKQPDWPQSDMQFGRFLEWIKIFEAIGY